MKEFTLDGKSLDIIDANIKNLKEIFPEVFVENKIDFNKLKEILGSYTDTENERYNLSWNGKTKAIRNAQSQSTGTLRPCKNESKNWENTKNIYIEGDNLEVLKLLQKSYHNKIKMIYIDPPYNTGSDFIYEDDFSDSIDNYKKRTGQVDSEGYSLKTNTEKAGRYHTNWLNMIYPRLKLARNLLSENGVMFISIDDNEIDNLKKVCFEIFGEDNVETLIWNKEASGSSGTLKQTTTTRRIHEYIVCAYKNYSKTQFNKVREPLAGKENELQTANLAVNSDKEKTNHPNYFTITNPSGDKFTRQWKWNKEEIDKLIRENLIYWGSDGHKQPRLIIPTDERRTTYLLSILNYGGTTIGRKDFESIMGEDIEFSYPKPIILLKKLIETSTDKDSIILDFFSGSGTTAHACLQLNKEDNGHRRFIMVQLPEKTDSDKFPTICEIGKERIRKAGELIGDTSTDTGFKVFKLDSSNIKKWIGNSDNIEQELQQSIFNYVSDRSESDIVYEIMLKCGLDLSAETESVCINQKYLYLINKGEMFICMDDDISQDIADKIIELKDERNIYEPIVVFKDNGFRDDASKTNIKESLRIAKIKDFITV